VPHALFEQAYNDFIDYTLDGASNVRCWWASNCAAGTAPVHRCGTISFQSAIANAVASFAGNRRVVAGGNYSGTASAMMLQGTSGTLQIQVNNLGADPCTQAWRSAIDASGLVA